MPSQFRRLITGTLALLLLVLLPASLVLSGSAHAQGGITGAKLRALLSGSVKLWTPVGTPDVSGNAVSGTCSSTVLDTAGFLLTNFHCTHAMDDQELADQGLHKGDLLNPDGLSVVLITADPRKLPKPMYVAKYLAGDIDADVAVLKIEGFFGGTLDLNSPTPASLPLTPIALGNADNVQIDDAITIVGYPGIGGATVTVTAGKISGFLDDPANTATPSGTAWFKTDALVNHGNSGGTTLNDQGLMIGIPTLGLKDPKSGDQINALRPVNFAVPYIEQAHKLAGTAPDPNPNPDPNPKPNPNPSGGPALGAITFGTGFDNTTSQAQNPGTSFASGLPKVFAVFTFQNIKPSTPYTYTWTVNGQLATSTAAPSRPWNFGAAGTVDFSLTGSDSGLPDGTWAFQIALKGGPSQQGQFTVGSKAPVKPKPPQPPAQGVTLKGQLVDADTGEPLSSASFFVLKPGVTVAQFFGAIDGNRNIESMVQGSAQTDAQGMFVVTPSLPRNQTYGAAAGKKGYQREGADNFIKIDSQTPSVALLDPISLSKQ